MTKSKLLYAALGFAVSGCVSTTPQLDSRFGDAVNQAKVQQTLNPAASKNTDPVVGLDGTSSKDSIDRYHDSFKAPVQTFEVLSGSGGR
jgi:predicted Zn-dependent protease